MKAIMRSGYVVMGMMLLALPMMGQQAAAPAAVPAPPPGMEVRFTGKDQKAVIPFDFTGRGIVFRVTAGGSRRALRFSLDTGAGSTYLDTKVAKALKLEMEERKSVQAAGLGRVQAMEVDDMRFDLPGLTTSKQKIRVTDLSSLTPQVDGFFGYDFIRRFVITIDYDAKKITIQDPATFTYSGAGELLPLMFRGGWPYLAAEIKVPGNAEEKSVFLLDTGSADAVNHPSIKKSTGNLRETKTGVGLGTPTQGVIGNVEYLQLGKYKIEGAPSVCCGGSEATSRQIGNGVLMRFKVILDYPHARMILEPGKHFGDAF